ncbi:MAG: hypothetical protein WAZ98_08745 [Cyclobacteriaceae bacterium]
MTFDEIEEYGKDFKKLQKKYKTLESDIAIVKKVLAVHAHELPPFNSRLNGMKIKTCVIKERRLACRSIKGAGVQTGLKLVYAHFEDEEKIVFIELYHEDDKQHEDRERILKNFK